MTDDHIPNEPTGLAATITEGGVRLTFDGNNPAGAVFYLIWRKDGKDGRWLPRGTTEEQEYVDVNLVPGETYTYRIQAQAPKKVSQFSLTVVVQIPDGKGKSA